MVGLSTGSSWAVLALACLAQTEKRVLARDLAASLGAPLPYLSKILHQLSQAGLVDTKRGLGGGFVLTRSADQITAAEVVGTIEGEGWLAGCLLGSAVCSDERACPTHAFWKIERQRIRAELEQLTIRAVAEFEAGRGRRFIGSASPPPATS